MRVFQIEFEHKGVNQVEFVKASRSVDAVRMLADKLGLRGRILKLVRIIEVIGGK